MIFWEESIAHFFFFWNNITFRIMLDSSPISTQGSKFTPNQRKSQKYWTKRRNETPQNCPRPRQLLRGLTELDDNTGAWNHLQVQHYSRRAQTCLWQGHGTSSQFILIYINNFDTKLNKYIDFGCKFHDEYARSQRFPTLGGENDRKSSTRFFFRTIISCYAFETSAALNKSGRGQKILEWG